MLINLPAESTKFSSTRSSSPGVGDIWDKGRSYTHAISLGARTAASPTDTSCAHSGSDEPAAIASQAREVGGELDEHETDPHRKDLAVQPEHGESVGLFVEAEPAERDHIDHQCQRDRALGENQEGQAASA